MYHVLPVVVFALASLLPQPSAESCGSRACGAPACGAPSPMAPRSLTVVLGCPHCGNQRSYRVSDNATQSVTDSWSGGGCGRSFRVHVSRGLVQGVWK